MSKKSKQMEVKAKQVVENGVQIIVRHEEKLNSAEVNEWVIKDSIWCAKLRNILNESYKLVMVFQNGKRICAPVVTDIDKIDDGMMALLNHGLGVYDENLVELTKDILRELPKLPELIYYDKVGFHKSPLGSLLYCGAEVLPFEADENSFSGELMLDGAKSLERKGEISKSVDFFSRVIAGKVNAQIVVAVGFAAVLIGILNLPTILMNLCGSSSVGKTIFSALVSSIFSKSDDPNVVTNFDSTEMAIETFMHENRGISIVVDDASTADNARKFKFEKLIYVLSKGIGRRRLNQGSVLNDLQTWNLSIITSSEVSILKDVDRNKLGTLRRLIELQVGQGDLTSDADEALEIKRFIRLNYGLLAPAFIMKLTANGFTKEKLEELLEEEIDLIQSETIKDGISQGYAEMIAPIVLVAKLVQQLLGIRFDVNEIQDYLIENGKLQIEAFKNEKGSSVPIDQVVKSIIEYGQKYCSEWNKEGVINIPSREFAALEQEYGYQKNDIKAYLKDKGLLNIGRDRTHDNSAKSNNGTGKVQRVISIKLEVVE